MPNIGTGSDISMNEPIVANGKGFQMTLQAGQRYLWCSCGRSSKQPFCDGSHVGTSFKPISYRAERDEDVIFCGCKHTKTGPFCDGTHNNLPGGYKTDDPGSPENLRVREVQEASAPLVRLDGECYVFSTGRADLLSRGSLRYCAVISPALGARYQSQFYVELDEGLSPVISAAGRDTVLFVSAGCGELEIGSQRVAFGPRDGLYVRPTEAYRIRNTGTERIKIFISNGPGSEDLVWLPSMPDVFESAYPSRRAQVHETQRHKMAERHFQMLVHTEHGSRFLTQFIGNIPLSKAEPHRHLYEEALIFLNGSGMVWTENTKTVVSAGDVLFLPSKQIHSVQCTCTGGFDVVGVIYPGDNPAVNY
jgi:mannose-6-phosphate isomerase-like protein (cupin superfamily)/CDGSH-type Zn-finger protein